MIFTQFLADTSTDIVGKIKPPSFFDPSSGGYGGYQTGITAFISNIIRLLTIVAGLWMLINFILAGLKFISSQGDEKAVASAWSKIYNSIIGMVVIVTAYALVALLSYLFFGDAGFILNPKITGPETQQQLRNKLIMEQQLEDELITY